MAENFDAEYEIVVIGGGAAGLFAAAQAATNGNSVALLEKLDSLGGHGRYIEGSTAFESAEQKKRGIDVSIAMGFKRLMSLSSWRADPEVVSMFVHNAATTIDKLGAMGAVWDDVSVYALEQDNELATMHWAEGGGVRVIELLEGTARANGAEVFVSTRAARLILDGDRVVGVEAEQGDGTRLRIGAKAVLIAGGGYSSDPEMIARHSRFGENGRRFVELGTTGNTGDGYRLAIQAGGADATTGAMLLMPVAKGRTISSHVSGAGSQPYLWVNKFGKRFTDETVAMNFADAANVIAQTPDAVTYTVFDAATRDYLMTEGSDIGLGSFIPFRAALTGLEEELEADAGTGTVHKADSLADLARQIGCSEDTLQATVDRYNAYCDAGHDDDFFKTVRYLRPVRQAPFYAVTMIVGTLVSLGGIKVNGNLQVISAGTGEPVPGLYAIGADASGLWGDSYPLDIPGAISGFAYTSGWVAADHAGRAIAAGQ